MFPGALGTETRQPLHFGHRRLVSETVPSGAPGWRSGDGDQLRPFGSNAASPTRRVRGGGAEGRGGGGLGGRVAASGAPFAPMPGRRTRLRASPGHAPSLFADVAAEPGGARWNAEPGDALRPPPKVGLLSLRQLPPRPVPGSLWQRRAERMPPEGWSRGIWPVPPLTERVARPLFWGYLC